MLASSALPQVDSDRFLKISSRAELAEWLNLTDRKLRYILYVLLPNDRYRSFEIRKRHGGSRAISAPTKVLMRLQRRLLVAIAHIGQAAPPATGFVKGKSIVDHAKIHAKRRWVLCLDLKDFFPSIKFWRVRGMFMAAPFSFNEEVATCLAQLCTHNQELPQGAPTSPAISNIICRGLDRRIKKLCRQEKCAYTRYADDLCVSSNLKRVPESIARKDGERWVAGQKLNDVIIQCGFALNAKKTRLKTECDQQMVTGLVVNNHVATPRSWRRQLRVMLHLRRKYGDVRSMEIVKTWAWHGVRRLNQKSIDAVVAGKASFAAYIEKDRAPAFTRSLFNGYPGARDLIPKPYRDYKFRVLTEGGTDVAHLTAALRRMSSEGKFNYLLPKFPDLGIKGSPELLKELYSIAKFNPIDLTIGVFDADEPRILRELKLEPGEFVPMGIATYALCLGRPHWVTGPFCMEDLYRWDEASAFVDGCRLFKTSEFNEAGLTSDGKYRFVGQKGKSIYVTQTVRRVADDSSVLLSKQKFSEMVLVRHPPFDEMDFSGFEETFDIFRRIIDFHLLRMQR
jgi:RNA-directed DNA polymerase